MNYGDSVEVKEDMDNVYCPFCRTAMGQVIKDYTGYHEREVLIHCDNPKCDNLFIRVYKYSHTIKLVKEIRKEE